MGIEKTFKSIKYLFFIFIMTSPIYPQNNLIVNVHHRTTVSLNGDWKNIQKH